MPQLQVDGGAPAPDPEPHFHVVTLDEDRFTYSLCDECGEPLPFTFDMDWTTEQLVRTAHEHSVRLHFAFIPIEDQP